MRDYYMLTKPGIIRGNLLVAMAGFFLASKGDIDRGVGVGLLIGLSFVVASACVANNIIDRDIDKKMHRTRQRAVASGRIAVRNAVIFASVLGIIGTVVLFELTSLLATSLAIIGWLAYVLLYGIGKRKTVHGTVIGSISGAIPPVVGYTAVTQAIDAVAVLLFVVLVFWQMPHFYAIAIYRMKDYALAGIPVLPLQRNIRATKVQIIGYIVCYVIATVLLAALGHAGLAYLVVVAGVGIVWLWLAMSGFGAPSDEAWAKRLFKFSLLCIFSFSLMISLDAYLP